MKSRKKIKVEVLRCPEDGSKVQPAVLYYPNGTPWSTDLEANAIFTNDDSDHFSVIHRDDDHNVTFIGNGPSKDGHTISPCSYAFGMFTKRTRSLKLMPILGNSVFRMEPRIDEMNYTPSAATEALPGTDNFQQLIAGNIKTMSTFAGGQTKKRLKLAQQGKFDVQTVPSKVALKSITDDIAAKAEEDGLMKDQVYEDTISKLNLPPFHLEATTAEEAFVFDELCPVFLQSDLEPEKYVEALTVEEAEMELRKNAESRFVLSQIQKFKNMDTTTDLLTSIFSKISFLSALLKLNKLSKNICKSKLTAEARFAEEFGFNPSLFSFMVSIFFDKREIKGETKYTFPDSKRHLLHGYILVMTFLVNKSALEFTEAETLRAELVLTPKSLLKLLQSVGAKMTGKYQEGEWKAKLLTNGKSLLEHLPKLQQNISRKFQ